MPWSELQAGLMRSPLLRTLQGSSCLDLDISIVLASCSPELNMFQKCSECPSYLAYHILYCNSIPSHSHLVCSLSCFCTFNHKPSARSIQHSLYILDWFVIVALWFSD